MQHQILDRGFEYFAFAFAGDGALKKCRKSVVYEINYLTTYVLNFIDERECVVKQYPPRIATIVFLVHRCVSSLEKEIGVLRRRVNEGVVEGAEKVCTRTR